MAVATPPSPKNRPLSSPQDGVIRQARRRRRLRLFLQSTVVLGILLGGTAIAIVSMSEGDPTSASRVHRGAVGRPDPAPALAIRLSPSLDGATYGWCVGVEEGTGGIAGGGCGALPVSSRPIVMTLSMGSATTRTESVVVLTTPAVASVLVNGTRRVATRVVPGLLYGLRAAHVVLPVHVVRSPSGRVGFRAPPEPRLLALAANGRAIATAPVIPHPAPGAMSSGPCRLTAGGIPGLAPQWSHVASSIIAAPAGLVGPAFFSCIDVEYYLGKWPLDAAVLLDAAHPGSPPAAIPGLHPVPGHTGFFNGPGDFKGELTATRRGEAWLVVAGGSGLAQRLRVLSHLGATISGLHS